MDHPLITRPPAPTPAPATATAAEPSAAELLARADTLQKAVEQINGGKKTKNLIFVAVVLAGIASLAYWGLTGTTVNNNKTSVDLGCIELRKLHPTAKCPGEDGYASLPPARSSGYDSPPPTMTTPQSAYVPPPVRSYAPPPQTQQTQQPDRSWGPVINLGRGNVEVDFIVNSKGRALICGDVAMPTCLLAGYTAPGAELDEAKCGPNRRILQIIPGECAKISKL
ncbi:TPA: hypothetical protein DEP94_00840 [Candidatus Nomurabacteria bacterium]|nr:hypothetical protein [Candidatus Nomurabacteria bacterium]